MTIPHKTRRAIREHGPRYRPIARALGVNVRYVHDLLKYSKEPSDTTEPGRAVRVRMGFPRRMRRKRDGSIVAEPGRVTLPEYERWWRRLPKAVRAELKRQLWTTRT